MLHVKRRNSGRRGFTLVEIMVVVVIIGLLAATVGPRLIGQSDEAKITAAKTQMAQFAQALDLYHLKNGFYPTTDQGLAALVSKPSGSPEPKNYPKGGFMKKIPQDPWKNDYMYRYPGERSEYDLYSFGADGQEGGEGNNTDLWASD